MNLVEYNEVKEKCKTPRQEIAPSRFLEDEREMECGRNCLEALKTLLFFWLLSKQVAPLELSKMLQSS